MDADRLILLENLVEELIKPTPEEKKVKEYMKQTGLEYTADPIDRLNMVLKALHFVETKEENKEGV